MEKTEGLPAFFRNVSCTEEFWHATGLGASPAGASTLDARCSEDVVASISSEHVMPQPFTFKRVTPQPFTKVLKVVRCRFHIAHAMARPSEATGAYIS